MRAGLFILAHVLLVGLTIGGEPGADAERGNAADRSADAVEALEAKLDGGPIDLAFDRVPLAGAVRELADRHDLDVFVDHVEIADEGFQFEQLVARVESTPATLRQAFELLFASLEDDLDLTAVNDRGVLTVTTRNKSYERHVTRVYDTRALLRQATAGEVSEVVQYGTSGPWLDLDGTGGVIRTVGSLLVVRCRYELHREIAALLGTLTEFAGDGQGLGVPFGSEVPAGALLFEPASDGGFWGGPSIEVRECCPVVGEFVVTDGAGEATSRHRGRLSRPKRPGLGQDEPPSATGGSPADEAPDNERLDDESP